MRKRSLIPLAIGSIFIVSGVSGQGVSYTANPNPEFQNNGLAMPGRNNSTGQTGTGNNGTTDPDDPSLQRLKSQDSLGQGSMSRDEGQLTAKARRREKISKVESTKQLPTSGIDPKFQGSLLHSSVSSIEDVGDKAIVNPNANATASTAADADTGPKFENDPRFGGKRFVFTPMTTDESKKKESQRTQADSSPSPSPSPSASVTPSSH